MPAAQDEPTSRSFAPVVAMLLVVAITAYLGFRAYLAGGAPAAPEPLALHLTTAGVVAAGVFLYLARVTVVAVHELGHVAAARACGLGVVSVRIGRGPVVSGGSDRRFQVRLLPAGGATLPVRDADNAAARALIALAGPAVNLALAVACGVPFRLAPLLDASWRGDNLARAVLVFGALNLVSGLYNLVPMRVGSQRSDGLVAISGARANDDVARIRRKVQEGDFEAARRMAAEAPRPAAGHPMLCLLRASEQFRNGDYAASHRLLREVANHAAGPTRQRGTFHDLLVTTACLAWLTGTAGDDVLPYAERVAAEELRRHATAGHVFGRALTLVCRREFGAALVLLDSGRVRGLIPPDDASALALVAIAEAGRGRGAEARLALSAAEAEMTAGRRSDFSGALTLVDVARRAVGALP